MEKNPIWLNADHSYAVPIKVKLYKIVDVFTIKKAVDKDLKIDKSAKKLKIDRTGFSCKLELENFNGRQNKEKI